MQGVKKQHLPTKICLSCGKPFSWRKKWERNWDDVKYCSDKCRSMKPKAQSRKQQAEKAFNACFTLNL